MLDEKLSSLCTVYLEKILTRVNESGTSHIIHLLGEVPVRMLCYLACDLNRLRILALGNNVESIFLGHATPDAIWLMEGKGLFAAGLNDRTGGADSFGGSDAVATIGTAFAIGMKEHLGG